MGLKDNWTVALFYIVHVKSGFNVGIPAQDQATFLCHALKPVTFSVYFIMGDNYPKGPFHRQSEERRSLLYIEPLKAFLYTEGILGKMGKKTERNICLSSLKYSIKIQL